MEVHQLRYLVALAAEQNFTRAAARAHVTQPALSRQIQRLEDELGVALVDRTNRAVRLTPTGTKLARRAQAILADLDDAAAAARGTRAELSGRVAVGVAQTLGPIDVSALLSDFHARHPGVELSVRQEISVDLADLLRSDDLDLAIIADIDESALRGLKVDVLAVEQLVTVVGHDDRLAAQATVRLDDLADRALVVGPPGASVRRIIGDAANAANLTLHFAFESNANDRILEMVARGLAVTVLPAADAPAAGDGLRTLPIEPTLSHRILLARRARRRLSPPAAALHRLVLDDA